MIVLIMTSRQIRKEIPLIRKKLMESYIRDKKIQKQKIFALYQTSIQDSLLLYKQRWFWNEIFWDSQSQIPKSVIGDRDFLFSEKREFGIKIF